MPWHCAKQTSPQHVARCRRRQSRAGVRGSGLVCLAEYQPLMQGPYMAPWCPACCCNQSRGSSRLNQGMRVLVKAAASPAARRVAAAASAALTSHPAHPQQLAESWCCLCPLPNVSSLNERLGTTYGKPVGKRYSGGRCWCACQASGDPEMAPWCLVPCCNQ